MTWKMTIMFFAFAAILLDYAYESVKFLSQIVAYNWTQPLYFLVGTVDPPAYLFFLPIIVGLLLGFWFLFSLNRWGNDNSVISFVESSNPSVDVVLTAYNDDKSIGQVVRDFKAHPLVKSVFVVDNNSKDRTEEMATKEGAIVHRESRQGYGYACISGLRYALEHGTSSYIALCEGDGTFMAADLDKMIPYLANVHMVVGSRTTKQLIFPDSQMDTFYLWGNLFIAKLIQIKFFDIRHWGRIRITDVGCTFRVIRREALTKIVDSLKVGGHHFSPHMIMVAISNGISMVEIPITFRKRVGISKGAGGSHKLGFIIGLKMVWNVLWF